MVYLSFLEGIRELTLKFSGSAAGLFRDSSLYSGCEVTVSFMYGVVYLIDRLICVSFGVTRLIRASFGVTRLMCKGTARDRPTRGKKDA
ncbi:hypothetical protein E6C27_scaffold102G001230 [Cucumis melo var. makuwa]|uniref:Uncharacterized protein n=1 Tax=Cucumis melo var. makuwa TaxID=1194695 RepID=A0A5A7UGG0_CUCMM|nr:hypothetical protein E6C27_scaffold102G001230 [Cucumis melo var. makuwa]